MVHSVSNFFKVWSVRGIMSSNGECSHLYNPPNPQVPIHFGRLTLLKECVFADTRTRCVLSTLLEFHQKPQWALEIHYYWHFSLESLFIWRVFCWDRTESPFVSSKRRLRCLHHLFLKPCFKRVLWNTALKKNQIPHLHAVCLFKCTEISHFCHWASACFGGAFAAGKAGAPLCQLLLSSHWCWDSQSCFLECLTGALILLPFTAPHLSWFQDFISHTRSVLRRHKAEQQRGASVLSGYLRRLLIHWYKAFVVCSLFPADISASTKACVMLNMCTPVLLAAHFARSLPSVTLL